ncbi:unnamed protein product [Schistosoma rodhaini]|uniref:NFACT RNA-binding domain-containing protein n=1 Tax=Schistosoma rodhaini TaxID=6188 RepID=A0AA85F104_9TREM|nr:unnamed protein product [Schistosoma rodhaini]
MKVLYTTFDVMVSVSEIKDRILGYRVNNIYDVDNKTYLLKLASTKSDDKTILLLESGSRLHLTDFDWPKNIMPSGFSMKLRKHIRNKKIVDISQIGADRVVDIHIGYESSAYHLIVELYDRGNMLLTDESFTILHLLRPRTDKNQNIRFAAHEKYPTTSCRQILECFRNLKDQKSLKDIENFLIPLFQSSKGPWTSNPQTCDSPSINKTLSSELPYGNVIIEHCMRVAQNKIKQMRNHKDFQLQSEKTDLIELYVEHFAVALRDILLEPFLCDRQPTPHGYIFGKSYQSSDEGLRNYEEFHPFMFEQYRDKPHLAFDSFNKAVDAYFSKIESQKTLEQISRNEQKASRKVENIKKDQERRLMLLKTEQELDMRKAYLLEANRQLVDNIIIMINHALSNQIDWKELELIVEDAKQRDDPLACHIVELKLQTSQAVIRLKDPFESSSDVDETLVRLGNKDEYTEVVVDIDVNALTNARKYYDKKRAASKKEEKTINVSRKVLKSAIHNAEIKMKTAKTVAQITEVRKPMWFEKFFWFISSENYLVVAGHDSQQNEVLVKRYLKPGDIFVHADIHGASTVIIKARYLTSEEVDSPNHQDLLHHHSLPLPPPKTLSEAGNMAVVLSSAWQSHVLTRAWWVHHDQVSKTAPSGEYLTSGAFMIRGKKNYLPPCPFDYGFGIMFKLHEDSIAKHKGERRIIIIDTPSYEVPVNQIDSLTIQNNEETAEFPDALLQLDLANDLPRHKDPDVSEILSKNPFKKVKTKSQKVDKLKPTKKTTNLNRETIEAKDKVNEPLLPSAGHPILKRGQKAKIKKIKQKYKEQDDEERNLRMKILQGDDAKPSQYHQILERHNLSNLIKIPQCVLDTQVVYNSDSIQNNQPDCDNNESFDDSSSEIENNSVKSDESEEGLQSLEVNHVESNDNDDKEDMPVESKDDLTSLLNSLTGQPNDDDLLLYAIPVCAPYSVLLKYKFRVKLNPGTTKRGKASKMALFQFTSDKSTTNRERELIRAMKDEEVSRNFPGCVKLTLSQVKPSRKK